MHVRAGGRTDGYGGAADTFGKRQVLPNVVSICSEGNGNRSAGSIRDRNLHADIFVSANLVCLGGIKAGDRVS